MITFTNASFGRGTDFVCFDEEISPAGGIHVLLTYFPADFSDLVQI